MNSEENEPETPAEETPVAEPAAAEPAAAPAPAAEAAPAPAVEAPPVERPSPTANIDPVSFKNAHASPAVRKFARELGVDLGATFNHFSDAAQRLGVYTSTDYIDILESLLKVWSIDKVTELNEAGEKARDYLMKLPDRLKRVSERLQIPETTYEYSWIGIR